MRVDSAPPAASLDTTPAPPFAAADTALVDTMPHGRTPYGDNHGYIREIFMAATGDIPRMGWLIPPNRVLSHERRPRLAVIGPDGATGTAPLAGAIGPDEHRRLSREHVVACEDTAALAWYELPGVRHATVDRVLFTTGALPDGFVSGMDSVRLAPAVVAAVRRRLDWSDPGQYLHAGLGLRGGGRPFYSINGYYDTAGVLVQSALVLHDTSGAILWHSTTEGTDYECDGCGIPEARYGLAMLMAATNVLWMRGFQYPLLLADGSTIEGRGVALMTFTPEGAPAVYGMSEYAVTCILGDPQERAAEPAKP